MWFTITFVYVEYAVHTIENWRTRRQRLIARLRLSQGLSVSTAVRHETIELRTELSMRTEEIVNLTEDKEKLEKLCREKDQEIDRLNGVLEFREKEKGQLLQVKSRWRALCLPIWLSICLFIHSSIYQFICPSFSYYKYQTIGAMLPLIL